MFSLRARSRCLWFLSPFFCTLTLISSPTCLTSSSVHSVCCEVQSRVPCLPPWTSNEPEFTLALGKMLYLPAVLLFFFSNERLTLQSACNAGDEFHPWVGKIPWRRKQQPTPVFLPGKSHGQRSLVCYSPPSGRESAMTGQLTHTHW